MKIPYDDYNSKICWSKVLGTLTTEAPRTAFRHGHKIIEVYDCTNNGSYIWQSQGI